MPSVLNVDSIVDKAGSGGSNVKMANTSTYVSDGGNATQNTVQGLGKAWANYSQTDNTVRDSLNISSVTDTSAGIHAYVFSNNMSNANWAGGFITRNNRHQWNTDEGATTGRGLRVANSANGVSDCDSNTLICMGDLA